MNPNYYEKLDAWIDFNRNGSWSDAEDQIFPFFQIRLDEAGPLRRQFAR